MKAFFFCVILAVAAPLVVAQSEIETVTRTCTLPGCAHGHETVTTDLIQTHPAPPAHPFIRVLPTSPRSTDSRPAPLPPVSRIDRTLRVTSYLAAAGDLVSTKIGVDRGGRELVYRGRNGGVRWSVAVPAKIVPLVIADILEWKGHRRQARVIRVGQIAIGLFATIWNLR